MLKTSRKGLCDCTDAIYKDGEPNEDAILEMVIPAFCNLVQAIRKGVYSENQVKAFFERCKSSSHWKEFKFYLYGYYTACGNKTSCKEWEVINDDLTFYVYCYYFTEMVDMLNLLEN